MFMNIDNCCSLAYLDCLKNFAIESESWHLRYPEAEGIPIEKKFMKLDIINSRTRHPILAGLAIGLLLQIHEKVGQHIFFPDINICGISIKDKHSPRNLHTDQKKDENYLKIVGLLNSDWKEEWGGGLICNGKSSYVKPTSFCIFDPSEEHATEEIFTDKKRFAIDFTVLRKI